ncbi:MAG: SpoIIE family protein phosphatase [Thiomargarita sp.]|nr:SpoIIE family protein phosphatase [Thiomargarita sp.]
MLEVNEEYFDKITETFYLLLRGERPSVIELPKDYPDNELKQVVSYINKFIVEFNINTEFMYSLSRGELDYDPPKSKMLGVQSFKNLQASLRHLTWKTQQIANGDFTQRVDFIGDFSEAFNTMTQQLEQAFTDIENANAELALKNKQITSSIRYAQRIQLAILPSKSKLDQTLGNYFIIYYPKDIVSGDFYWLTQVEDKIFLAVVDCTGHGVPGAFLSMIANTLLTKIVNEHQIFDPAKILEQLHIGIRTVLQQETSEAREGMDVCLCQIDKTIVKFAGANRPLFHCSQKELTQIKGDRKSIGGLQKEEQRIFTSHEISVQTGDTLYLSTDGMVDQQNPIGKKFGSKQLKLVLQDIASKTVDEQKEILLTKFLDHKQQESQRDDVTLMGIQF